MRLVYAIMRRMISLLKKWKSFRNGCWEGVKGSGIKMYACCEKFRFAPPPPGREFHREGKVHCPTPTDRLQSIYWLDPSLFFDKSDIGWHVTFIECYKGFFKGFCMICSRRKRCMVITLGHELISMFHASKNVYANKNFLDRMLIMLYVDMYWLLVHV